MMRTESRKQLEGLRVLVVDDEEDIRRGLAKLVRGLGAEVHEAADGRAALDLARQHTCQLVLTDLMMPHMSGSELLCALKEERPEVEVVILTGFGTVQVAVSALQNGAAHFMTKPFDNQEVLRIVSRIGRQLLSREDRQPRGAGEERALIAEDPAMLRVMELVERVARSPVSVLIEGESGTGKEVIARAIHERSSLAPLPFLAVNTAALPDSLLESELFGHERGSFTGAEQSREGIFREARGGTVFLDEVASMSPSFQGKLLRVLQERCVRPLGSSRDVPVEFRLIAASNKKLAEMIAREEFREDLFYRLSVVRIQLPRLRERPADILPLALRMLAHAAETCLGPEHVSLELSPAALEALQTHDWPGNVRELENVMFRAVIVCQDERILPHHLGLHQREWQETRDDGPLQYAEGKQRAIERFQREFVQRALEAAGDNISHAAEACGLTRAAFQRIMRQLGIERGSLR